MRSAGREVVGQRERACERGCVCVCVCVCEGERGGVRLVRLVTRAARGGCGVGKDAGQTVGRAKKHRGGAEGSEGEEDTVFGRGGPTHADAPALLAVSLSPSRTPLG